MTTKSTNTDGWVHATTAISQYNNIDASQVTRQYGVRAGLKIFGEDGVKAVLKELRQIHERQVVVPLLPKEVTPDMKRKALPYLMFLKRKQCGTVKGQGCADGQKQREFIS